MTRFRRYFVTGLVVVLPTFISFYVLLVVGEKLDNVLGGAFRGEWIRPGGIPGLGLLSACLLVLLVGIITSKTLGRKMVNLWDRILFRIPILNRVYIGLKQISEAVFQADSRVFRKVVLIEFPRRGCYAIGFKTEPVGPVIREKTGRSLVSVFLPTTPNPTSGYLLLLDEDEIIDLDISVEQGLKLVVSAGSVQEGEPLR